MSNSSPSTPTTLHNLPSDLLQLIISYLPTPSLLSLSLTSRTLHSLLLPHTLETVKLRSTEEVKTFLNELEGNEKLREGCRTLKVIGDDSTPTPNATSPSSNSEPTTKRRRLAPPSSSTITTTTLTEDTLTSLLTSFPHLLSLSLHLPSIKTLRRRHLIFIPPSLSNLTSLSITSPLQLHTLGLLLSPLSNLLHLSLKEIIPNPSALLGIVPPSYQLQSLSLLDSKGITKNQYKWLFRSTSHAESLKSLTLSFDTPLDSPRVLNSVRYTVLRVTRLRFITSTPHLIESFLLHFPSLNHLQISTPSSSRKRSNLTVSLKSLLLNLESSLITLNDFDGLIERGEWGMFVRGEMKGDSDVEHELREVGIGWREGEEEEEWEKLRRDFEKSGRRLKRLREGDCEGGVG